MDNRVGPAGAARRKPGGSAFGVTVYVEEAFGDLESLSDGTESRLVEVTLEDPSVLQSAVEGLPRTCLLDRRFPSGRQMLRIEGHNGRGYTVSAPNYGRHLIAQDGRRVQSALPRVPPVQWQRLFFAQVLPLAAALNGLEVLHASAVVLDGRAIGLVAPSGTGKTSVAVNLAALGAEILTDDVLAVEVSQSDVVAYSGARLVNLARHEYAVLDPTARHRVGTVVGRTDKVHLRPHPSKGSAPLSGLYFLRRDSARSGGVEILPSRPGDPRPLLGSTFIDYLLQPQYLTSHLDAAARIASAVPMFSVNVPGDRSARDVAAVVAEHTQSEWT